MSHLTKARLKLRDLDALETAAERCGLALMRGQTEHKWYGRLVGDSAEGVALAAERGRENLGKCEHALRLKDHTTADYEVGVVAAADGDGYELVYDSWGPGRRLEAAAEPGLSKLRREYAAAVATKRATAELARKGYRVERQDLGARIRLRLVKR